MKLSIIIVLYNKTIADSLTVQSVLRIKDKLKENIDVVVHNNGPSTVSEEFNLLNAAYFNSITLVETLENSSLSCIYNEFYNKNNADIYAFLDDDSVLNDNYFIDLICHGQSKFVYYPTLTGKYGHIVNPSVKGGYRTGPFNKDDTIYTITSGLAIGELFAQKILSNYTNIFDERFYFYGIDTSFSIRVMNLQLQSRIQTTSSFKHSLSKEENDYSTSDFRIKEVSYASALIHRHYFAIKYFPNLIKTISNIITGKSIIRFSYFIKAFISGKHYRN
ncbi:glycosyltransferase family 2 protein [Vibrio breoganii]